MNIKENDENITAVPCIVISEVVSVEMSKGENILGYDSSKH